MSSLDERTHPQNATTAGQASRRGSRMQTLALLTIVGSSVMDLLDSTIVNIAGPALRQDIGASTTSLQWIIAGYTLAFASMLITGARLGDVFGRKRMFLAGVAGFVTSSLLCSVAANTQILITGRVAQGAFAALMIPQGLGLIRAMFPADQMGKAFAVFGPMMGIGATAGPVIGGALIDGNVLGLGWRSIFLLNVPIGLLCLAGGARLLPADGPRGARAPRLDLTGMVLATLASLLLIYPLVQGREAGWPTWMLVMMGAAAPAFCLFALHQRARQQARRTPLVETSIMRNRAFCSGIGFVLLFFGATTGLLFALTLFLQVGEHFTPLHAGLTTLPWSIGGMISMAASQAILGKVGSRRLIQAGVIVMAAGLLGTAWTIQQLGTSTSSLALAPALLITGFGMSLVFAPFFDTVLAAVTDAETGSASGVVSAVEQLGSALGVAGLGTVFFGRVATHGATGAATPVFLITAGALVLAWAIAFLMPKTVRRES